MIHPHTEVRYIDEYIGSGLFATEDIPRGTIIWVQDELDREISPEQVDTFDHSLREILLTYSFRNSRGNYIFCWDNGRYINHSFHSNCCLTPYGFEIVVNDISTGEEITDDYGYLNIIEPFAVDPQGSGRSVVYPDDLLHYSDVWDEQLRLSFPLIKKNPQPLQRFLPKLTVEIIDEIHSGRRRLDSIRNCYCGSR